jgi:uncharacterized protein (DUF1684 family)
MPMPCNQPLSERVRPGWGLTWRLLLALGLLLPLISCGHKPNRIETLRYQKKIQEFRHDKDRFFKTSQNSPLLSEQQWKFTALSYFPVDIAYRVTAHYQRMPKPLEFQIQTSTGHVRDYITIGRLDFTLSGKPLTLFAYQEKGEEPPPREALFIPFTDLTSGKETYGAGRFLDVGMPTGDSVVLDFNLAYNPYCAYNHNFSCPVPPAENHLDVAISAGEKPFPLAQP